MFDLELAARTDPSPRPAYSNTTYYCMILTMFLGFKLGTKKEHEQFIDALCLNGAIEVLTETKRNPMSVRGLAMRMNESSN